MNQSAVQFGGARWGRWGLFVCVAIVLVGSGIILALSWPKARTNRPFNVNFPTDLRMTYAALVRDVRIFEDRQSRAGTQLVTDRELQNTLSRIQLDAADGNFALAKSEIKDLHTSLANWNLELSGGNHPQATPTVPAPAVIRSGFLPIVLYHYTPPNFEQQLEYLEQHGYTVVDMDEALAGLNGGPLPTKPVVLTFDDGFANQMQAFDLLQKHHMKATFYIINGGEASKWCIGAGRRYGDPLQPPGGCGDSYLTWDQVRALDRSGLITIGGHTLDHENLASLPAAAQRHEIADSKTEIERQIGHPIYHFAYPYGAYNAESVELARQAGYLTAVTTLPGAYQTPGTQYTLRRVRDTLTLP